MTRAARIERVLERNGQVIVEFTAGEMPLPPAWQGEGLVYASRQAVTDAVDAMLASLSAETLVLLQLAASRLTDPTLGQTFRDACAGKVADVDLTATRIVGTGGGGR